MSWNGAFPRSRLPHVTEPAGQQCSLFLPGLSPHSLSVCPRRWSKWALLRDMYVFFLNLVYYVFGVQMYVCKIGKMKKNVCNNILICAFPQFICSGAHWGRGSGKCGRNLPIFGESHITCVSLVTRTCEGHWDVTPPLVGFITAGRRHQAEVTHQVDPEWLLAACAWTVGYSGSAATETLLTCTSITWCRTYLGPVTVCWTLTVCVCPCGQWKSYCFPLWSATSPQWLCSVEL